MSTLERFPEKWQELLYSLRNQNINPSPFYILFLTPKKKEGQAHVVVRKGGGRGEIPRLHCSSPVTH